jgi:hypothetical protein
MTYVEELENAVVKRHGCATKHLATDLVEEVIQGKGRWRGTIATFALHRHPHAPRCYAWGNPASGGGWDIVTVLAIPPVASPETALRAALAARPKGI